MKKLIGVVAGVALLAVPTLSSAKDRGGPPPSVVDVYYIPSSKLDLDVPGLGSGDDDGDGYGVKGLFRVANNLGFNAEYQSTSLDDFDIDVDQLRLGVGWMASSSSSGIFVEYDKVDLDDVEADGFSVRGRLAAAVAPRVSLYADIGYLMISDDFEDIEGPEFTIGAAMGFTSAFGAFLDYRVTNIEGQDSEVEYKFSDLRVGVRFYF